MFEAHEQSGFLIYGDVTDWTAELREKTADFKSLPNGRLKSAVKERIEQILRLLSVELHKKKLAMQKSEKCLPAHGEQQNGERK